MSREPDPVLKNARREAVAIAIAWFLSMAYSCGYSYWFGYNRPGRVLGFGDVRPTFGMPSWFFWGVIVPWGVCAVFTIGFAGWVMTDDDLGEDHAPELEREIREGGLNE